MCWCVLVCVCAYARLQKHTVETISPQILSHRAGSSLLVSTSPHTAPFPIFLDTTRGNVSRFLSFQSKFQMNFCGISPPNSGWSEKEFSPLSWNLGESLNVSRPGFPFWVRGINNIYCDKAVSLQPLRVGFPCEGRMREKCKCYP